jgi:hypothetical protein
LLVGPREDVALAEAEAEADAVAGLLSSGIAAS